MTNRNYPILQNTEYWSMMEHAIGNGRLCPASPDGWPSGGWQLSIDEFDSTWAGENVLRIETGDKIIPTLPIRIRVTGRTPHFVSYYNHTTTYKIRVQFEHIRDGDESEFQGGWLYLWSK